MNSYELDLEGKLDDRNLNLKNTAIKFKSFNEQIFYNM